MSQEQEHENENQYQQLFHQMQQMNHQMLPMAYQMKRLKEVIATAFLSQVIPLGIIWWGIATHQQELVVFGIIVAMALNAFMARLIAGINKPINNRDDASK